MQQLQWHKRGDREALARDLAEQVAALLTAALDQQERVSLAVSGGSTPTLFFERLSQCDLSWQRVDLLLVDERWVAADSDQANEALIRNHLLRNKAAPAHFLSLLEETSGPQAAASRASRRFNGIVQPLTVAVMGVGSDGHTASWFPGDPASTQALLEDARPGYRVTRAPAPPHTRLTLTWPCIRDAAHCLLHCHGDEKHRVLEWALSGTQRDLPAPVTHLFQRPLAVYWSP